MKKQTKTKLLGCLAAVCLGTSTLLNVSAFTQGNFSVSYPWFSGAKDFAYGTNNDGDGLFAVFIESASDANKKSRYWLYEQGTHNYLAGTLVLGYNQYGETYYNGHYGQNVYLKGAADGSSSLSVSGYWRH